MFSLAISIGIYSYILFALGMLGFLSDRMVLGVTLLGVILFIFLNQNWLKKFDLKEKIVDFIKRRSKIERVFIALLSFQALINLLGALGPEFGFDALWYHLTLPKIYLTYQSIVHIPGSLLYYSDMPKLTELLYVAGLSFGSEIFAKLIHFSFGILTLFALYQLARKFFSSTLAFLVLVIFYSNLVVGWMSITAYVDLVRTFFEIMALWGFLEWVERKEKKWLMESAVMLGLAMSTKLLALGSLFIFSVLIIFYLLIQKKPFKDLFISLFAYWFICLLIPLPWFIFSHIHTGNPIYPFFSELYKVYLNVDVINPFIHKSDSISIVYILPFLILPFIFKKMELRFKLISIYSFLALWIWYFTPKTDTGRFILPYLPAFSILTALVIEKLKTKRAQSVFIGFVILVSLFTIGYRGAANAKYAPVILGIESKSEFLEKHLNFSFGDFYDTDNYFKKHIKPDDVVLLYGFHNLYYVDFPFIDSSFVKEGAEFTHIAVQNGQLPKRFSYWPLVYQNSKTHVKVYSLGGQKWMY